MEIFKSFCEVHISHAEKVTDLLKSVDSFSERMRTCLYEDRESAMREIDVYLYSLTQLNQYMGWMVMKKFLNRVITHIESSGGVAAGSSKYSDILLDSEMFSTFSQSMMSSPFPISLHLFDYQSRFFDVMVNTLFYRAYLLIKARNYSQLTQMQNIFLYESKENPENTLDLMLCLIEIFEYAMQSEDVDDEAMKIDFLGLTVRTAHRILEILRDYESEIQFPILCYVTRKKLDLFLLTGEENHLAESNKYLTKMREYVSDARVSQSVATLMQSKICSVDSDIRNIESHRFCALIRTAETKDEKEKLVEEVSKAKMQSWKMKIQEMIFLESFDIQKSDLCERIMADISENIIQVWTDLINVYPEEWAFKPGVYQYFEHLLVLCQMIKPYEEFAAQIGKSYTRVYESIQSSVHSFLKSLQTQILDRDSAILCNEKLITVLCFLNSIDSGNEDAKILSEMKIASRLVSTYCCLRYSEETESTGAKKRRMKMTADTKEEDIRVLFSLADVHIAAEDYEDARILLFFAHSSYISFFDGLPYTSTLSWDKAYPYMAASFYNRLGDLNHRLALVKTLSFAEEKEYLKRAQVLLQNAMRCISSEIGVGDKKFLSDYLYLFCNRIIPVLPTGMENIQMNVAKVMPTIRKEYLRIMKETEKRLDEMLLAETLVCSSDSSESTLCRKISQKMTKKKKSEKKKCRMRRKNSAPPKTIAASKAAAAVAETLAETINYERHEADIRPTCEEVQVREQVQASVCVILTPEHCGKKEEEEEEEAPVLEFSQKSTINDISCLSCGTSQDEENVVNVVVVVQAEEREGLLRRSSSPRTDFEGKTLVDGALHNKEESAEEDKAVVEICESKNHDYGRDKKGERKETDEEVQTNEEGEEEESTDLFSFLVLCSSDENSQTSSETTELYPGIVQVQANPFVHAPFLDYLLNEFFFSDCERMMYVFESLSSSIKSFDRNISDTFILRKKYLDEILHAFSSQLYHVSGLVLCNYGSEATGLLSTSSDFDFIVKSTNPQEKLCDYHVHLVSNWIERSGLFLTVQVWKTAFNENLPLLHFLHCSGIPVDISFDSPSNQGEQRTRLLQKMLCNRNVVRTEITVVVRIVKELLAVTKMNKPFKGGLSGYITFKLVCFSSDYFSQLYPNTRQTSSRLLLFFLNFFASFDCQRGIYVHPELPEKSSFVALVNPANKLWVCDPFFTLENIAKSAYQFSKCSAVFSRSFQLLVSATTPNLDSVFNDIVCL